MSITVNISGINPNDNPMVVYGNSSLGSSNSTPQPLETFAPTPQPLETFAPTSSTTFAPLPQETTLMPLPPTPTPGILESMTKEEIAQIALAEKEYIESLKYNETVKTYASKMKTDETLAFFTPQTKINYMKIFVIWVFAFLIIFLFQFSCTIMPQFPCQSLVALVLLVSVLWTFWLVFYSPS